MKFFVEQNPELFSLATEEEQLQHLDPGIVESGCWIVLKSKYAQLLQAALQFVPDEQKTAFEEEHGV